MFYAALDVSLRSVAICIIDQDGKVRFERSVRSGVPDLIQCLQAFGQPIHQVGFEAGALTQPITYGLVEAGYDVVCMEARQVAAVLSAMRNKTDKHDARGIAQILRSGWYSRVHVKSVESHHMRALLTSPKVMQRKCIDLENEILKAWGVRLMKTKGRRRAVVAVARKIAVVLHRMWADGADFRLGWRLRHDLTTAHTDPGRDRPTRTTGWMKPRMSAALRSASNSEALQTPDPMHACSGFAQQKKPPDCEEKRDPRERRPCPRGAIRA